MPLDLGVEPHKAKTFYLPSDPGAPIQEMNEAAPAPGPQTPANATLALAPQQQQEPQQGLGLGPQGQRGGMVNLPAGGVQQVPQLGIPASAQAAPPQGQSASQGDEQMPAWQKALMMLSGGLEGFSAGMQGRTPVAVLMAQQKQKAKQAGQEYLQNQRKLDMEQQKITAAGAQLQQENRANVLEAWRKGATELGPQEREQYFKALEPELKQYAPELLDHHHAIKGSEDGVKNSASLIGNHPLVKAGVEDIQTRYEREMATASPKEQAAIRSRMDTEIRSFLNSGETTKKQEKYSFGAATQWLATMPPVELALIKKNKPTFMDVVKELPGLKDAQGQPMPQFLQDYIKAGSPEVQRLLAMHGVVTPLVAEEEAKAALKTKQAVEEQKALAPGKVEAAKREPTLDPETLTFLARQALKGDTSVFQNVGRGTQGAANIVALREKMQQLATKAGITPEELASINAEFVGAKAGQRALGTRSAQFKLAASEAHEMADIVTQTSKAFDRTNFPLINKAIAAGINQTGSPEVVQFGAAINSFINAYARAISPTGQPTISDKDHARDILSKAQSPEQVVGVIKILKQEMGAASKSIGTTHDFMREQMTGSSGSLPTYKDFSTLKSGDEFTAPDGSRRVKK